MAGKRITTEEIYESNLGALKGAVTDPDLWAQWLATVGNHPKESALNCAAIMASPYEDTRELRNAEGWARFGGSVKKASRIPTVHRSKAGHLFCDILYPASAVEGANEKRYRGLPPQIDLEDEIDGPAYLAACKKWGEDIAQAGDTAMYAVNARYGIPNDTVPELPSTVLLEDAKALNEYCRAIKNEPKGLSSGWTRPSSRATQRHLASGGLGAGRGTRGRHQGPARPGDRVPARPHRRPARRRRRERRGHGHARREPHQTGRFHSHRHVQGRPGIRARPRGAPRRARGRRQGPLAPTSGHKMAAGKDAAPQPVRDAPSPSPERSPSSMNDAARAFAKAASANSAHGAAESQGRLQM